MPVCGLTFTVQLISAVSVHDNPCYVYLYDIHRLEGGRGRNKATLLLHYTIVSSLTWRHHKIAYGM